MADSNQVINLQTKGDENIKKATNSLKQLKQELKEAQAAALNGDGSAAARVAELTDQMDDLRDATMAVQGTGVEQLTTRFKLLGEGIADLDLDKIKLAFKDFGSIFKGIGDAMKALPLLLIVSGVQALIENWDKLKNSTGIIGKIFRGIGDAIDWVIDKITQFTDFIGATNSALDKQGEAIKKNADKAKEALDTQTAAYDRQIAVANAAGKSTVELEKAKQEAIVQTNLTIAKQIQAFVAAGGKLDDEKRKQLTAALEAIRNAKVQEQVIELQDQKQKLDKYKDYLKKWVDAHNQAIDERLKALDAEAAYEKNLLGIRVDFYKAAGIERKKQDEEEIIDTRDKSIILRNLKTIDKQENETQRKEELSSDLKSWDQRIKFAQEGYAYLQGLSDLVFSIKLANTKKGSEEEEKALRKQFQINKALQIANAAINGAQAVVRGISEFGPPPSPLGLAAIIAAGATTAATIAKISATQFQSSGASSGGVSPALPSSTSGGLPQVNSSPPAITPQGSTLLNGNFGQNNPPIKTYVVESEMTNAQRRVKRLGDQATF